eukprot:scaffold263215_cov39-Prasinocladus_malaysianus.AAC.8
MCRPFVIALPAMACSFRKAESNAGSGVVYPYLRYDARDDLIYLCMVSLGSNERQHEGLNSEMKE